MSQNDLVELALKFAQEYGVPVCPFNQDKKPLTPHSFKDATRDPDRIKAWFEDENACLIVMPTGEATGISVLDVDKGKDGDERDGYAWLRANRDLIPETHTVKTQNDGRHFYFRHRKGLQNSTSKIAPCVDVRGEGGCIVVAGRGYEVLNPVTFDLLLPFPEPILSQLNPDAVEQSAAPTGLSKSFNMEDHKKPGQWHDTVLRWVGREVASGSNTPDILEKSHQFTLPGYTDAQTEADVQIMLEGALKKGFAPSAGQTFNPLIYPLPASEKLPEFPQICFPPSLSPWLNDVADRMDISPEYVAAAAIVAASSIIGRRAAIKPKVQDDWKEHANLWGMLVAAPGEMKSPATAKALFPIKNLERKARDEWVAAETKLREMLNLQIEREKHLKKTFKDALNKPECGDTSSIEEELSEVHRKILKLNQKIANGGTRFLCNDATTEKLAELCAANAYGLLVTRDELSGWLASLSKPGREGDREFYLEAWSGDGEHSYDRIGRGTLYVPHLCLSIFGTIQPGKVNDLVAPSSTMSAGADGLLQRFQILLYPDQRSTKRWIDQTPDKAAEQQYQAVFEELAALGWLKRTTSLKSGYLTTGPDSSPVYLFSFDCDAQAIATDWFVQLEAKILKESVPAFKSHLAKYRGLMPRLALNYFLIEASAKAINCSRVPKDAVLFGIAWCEHLESHARKLWASALEPERPPMSALAQRIEAGQIVNGISLRDIQQSNWSGLKSVEAVEMAAQALDSLGWVKVVVDKASGGRPSRRLQINPELLLRLK